MKYATINDYLLREEQFFTVKVFYINSRGIFNNFEDILECVRLVDSKYIKSDLKNLLKYYYLGCSGLRLNDIDITCASLCLWSLAEQILDYYKENNIKINITPFHLRQNLKEIKNFYYRSVAKIVDDYRKIDPYEFRKK